MPKALKLIFSLSMAGLAAAIFTSGHIGFFPGMMGPFLVLFFFLLAAGSVIGLAIIRARRDYLCADRPATDHQPLHRPPAGLTRPLYERSR